MRCILSPFVITGDLY